MLKGLLTALLSMALWGLVFVLPLFIPQFSSFEVSMGRFISYGFVSTIYILFKGNFRQLPFAYWKQAAIFAMTSSLIYYSLLVMGIRCLGAVFTTAFCSLLPIMLSIYANFRHKVYAWNSLIIPLGVLLIGLLFVHAGSFTIAEGTTTFSLLMGLLLVTLALMMWSWYSVNNAEFLSRNSQVPSSIWSSFIGVFCLLGGGMSLGLVYLFTPHVCYLPIASKREILTYCTVSFLNGFCASWLTLYLWNRASRVVPMAILGQMSVFEVLFGLLYFYLIVHALPTFYETAGAFLIFSGLYLSFRKIVIRTDELLE